MVVVRWWQMPSGMHVACLARQIDQRFLNEQAAQSDPYRASPDAL
jgi:hypothetical protein